MKSIRIVTTSILFLFAIQSTVVAQTAKVTETFKTHFNETVQQVQQTESADEKRTILNESFIKMIVAIDRIDSLVKLPEDEVAQLHAFKMGIVEKQNELNGLNGYNQVMSDDLDDFSSFSQNYIEQANRTITIGISTVVLIIIILLLL
ncbi:MAG: hypothetical protein WDZ29_07370 [Balneolaceae bacterium]